MANNWLLQEHSPNLQLLPAITEHWHKDNVTHVLPKQVVKGDRYPFDSYLASSKSVSEYCAQMVKFRSSLASGIQMKTHQWG